MRGPFQGVINVVRFNWHFYILAGVLVLLFVAAGNYSNLPSLYVYAACLIVIMPALVSLFVTYYVYDRSNLYKFDWLDDLDISKTGRFLNINAGFDETSILLSSKYPGSTLCAFDFYDAGKHTEVSIKRARKAYGRFGDTARISTSNLPVQDNFADNIFVIFAAHEIRDAGERVCFFRELHRSSNSSGKIIVTEHLRDASNFLAYSIGFVHFLSRSAWCETFGDAGLEICNEIKITPFITTFVLEKNGKAH